MTDKGEISEEGRKARFEEWERLGLDKIKRDLAAGGGYFVGDLPQVLALAREWVHAKEAEKAAQERAALETVLRDIGAAPTSVTEILSGRNTDLRRLTEPTAAAAPVTPRARPTTPEPAEPQSELLTLKPTLWGMSIDLKEAGRRLRRWWKKGS